MTLFKLQWAAVLVLFQSCTSQIEKINGVSFVAARDSINKTHVQPVLNINANYAAVMPFGFIRHLQHPEITHNTDRQWFGETRKGAAQYIGELRKQDIKIMIKPQIWVFKGEFTGKIEMENEADWNVFEASHNNFIMEYAALAEEVKAEIFCIGTELENFIKYRPEYWKKLIKKIRNIYKGKLTYAANWDEFTRTPFWSDLDFIGVDAYFPVSENKTPTVEECLEGWKQHKNSIYDVHKTYIKPILFTEFGYRSVDFAGKQPWVSDRSLNQVNLEAQVNTTTALFEAFWHEDWFAGGFIWKWFHKHNKAGGHENAQFTPQNKPAEAVIKYYYEVKK
jgi:ppGpp synthetase/RelA/SpoT-type nucleotidyltranferase